MTHPTDLATLRALPPHRPIPSDPQAFDLDTVTQTAAAIVQDIVQLVAAGRVDQAARDAFCSWIVDAWLTLPTAEQVDQLCRAAGFSGPVTADAMRQRVDELHHTISAQLHELGQCYERLAVWQATGQAIVAVWEQGDLAYVVRRLAALLPK
jgi:hypothetical protein